MFSAGALSCRPTVVKDEPASTEKAAKDLNKFLEEARARAARRPCEPGADCVPLLAQQTAQQTNVNPDVLQQLTAVAEALGGAAEALAKTG